MRVGGGSGGGDLWVGAFVSRASRERVRRRMRLARIERDPERETRLGNRKVALGLPWRKCRDKRSPCEMRRYFRRHPSVLEYLQRSLWWSWSEQEHARELLTRIGLMPPFGPMDNPYKAPVKP